jgi:hypothetical protein
VTMIDTLHDELDEAVEHLAHVRRALLAVVGRLAVEDLDMDDARQACARLDDVEGALREFRAAL